MTVDLTNLTSSVNNLQGLANYSNDVTGGLLFSGFTIIIFVILLMSFKTVGFEKSFLSASWLTFLLATMLWYIHLLNVAFPLAFLVLTIISAFISFTGDWQG